MATIQSAAARRAKQGLSPDPKKPAAASKKAAGAKTAPTPGVVPATVVGPHIPGVQIAQPRVNANAAEKRRAALAAMASFKKDSGEAKSLVDKNSVDELCPTGSIVLDGVLGLGGFPLEDRITQIQGEEHCGKSTIFYGYAASFQRTFGEPVVILDHEKGVKPPYLRGCGLNLEDGHLFLHRPIDFNESLKLVQRYSEAGVRCFIFDSVPEMRDSVSAKAIKDGKAMDVRPGEHAAAFKQFLNVVRTHTRGCQLLFVNQIRDLIATNMKDQARVKYQTIDKPAYVVPGGRALKFATSLTLEAMKGKTFDKVSEDDEWLFPEITTDPDRARVWSINRTALRVLKNKVTGGGYRAYHLYTRPGMGIDDNISIRELAKAYDLIRGSSKGWVIGREGEANIAEFKNKDAILQALVEDEDPALHTALKEMLFQVIVDEDAKRFRYERTARDKFLAGDIEASEAKALGVTGAVDFEMETPGTSEMDITGSDADAEME